jgi:hypothetical protein
LNGLLFDPEDGGSAFLRNLDEFYSGTWHYIPEDGTSYMCWITNMTAVRILAVISENFREFKSVTMETFTKAELS